MSTFPYKNAADYGFLPGNDADANTAALQNALNSVIRDCDILLNTLDPLEKE